MENSWKNLKYQECYIYIMVDQIKKHLPLLCTVIFFLFINLIFIHPISGNDTWFHLRIGQDIWENKSIPRNDYHSFTAPGAPYINQSWLAQLIMYRLYHISGFIGLQILHTLLIFFTFLFLILVSRPKKAHITMFWIALLSPLAMHPDEIRPYNFTWFFLSLTIFLINRKKYHFIPIIFLLWSNIHAGFLLGIGILLYYLFREFLRTKKPYPLIIFFACLFTSFITPYGPKIYLYPLSQGRYPELMSIAEWQPFQPNSIYLWLYFAYIVSLIFICIKNQVYKKDLLEFIFIIFISLLGYSSRRHSFLVSFSLIPFYLKYLPIPSPSKNTKFIFHIFSCLIPITIFFWSKMYLDLDKITKIDYNTVPVYGLKFITDNKISGPVFNDYGFGGYFLWANPNEKVFVDGRLEIYSGGPNLELMAISNVTPIWSKLLDKYQINYIIIAPNRKLNTALLNHPNWELVYFDSTSVIYLRRGSYPQIRRLKNITPSNLQISQDNNLVIDELKYLVSKNPKFCFGYISIVNNYLQQGSFDQAKTYFNYFQTACPKEKNNPNIKKISTFLSSSKQIR